MKTWGLDTSIFNMLVSSLKEPSSIPNLIEPSFVAYIAPSLIDPTIAIVVAIAKSILGTISEKPKEAVKAGQQSQQPDFEIGKQALPKGKEVTNPSSPVHSSSPILPALHSEVCPKTPPLSVNNKGYNVVYDHHPPCP